ncbi:D-glycero-beta-D-manno-heptose 1-phosphate adenylyltransferase, partial [Paracoccaceae bacterium]|nr:D-glycero-beta-D-manno-heptose 1-phosphate adenylyltransferase [Paracoccaceae bacterium]
VVSDYNKGMISNRIMDLVRDSNTKFIVDPKIKDWSIYQDAFLISPNKNELKLAFDIDNNSIESATKSLSQKFNIKNIIVTLSEKGMYVYSEAGECQSIKATTTEIVDVTGAGDVVIAVLADQISKQTDIITAAKVANRMAGRSVQKIGAQVVGQKQVNQVKNHTNLEDTIVFTNGCFDILHAGHVDFLQRAKSYGNKLFVGLNSDSSVRNLKGETRPINPLKNRKKVLEALDCVDAVIEFDEETPENLIKQLMPNVLVKGADWKGKEIAGGNFVTASGGKVVLLKFKYQISTTDIIKKVNNQQ